MYRVFYAILFYFVDYRIPLSQIKIVLFIYNNIIKVLQTGLAKNYMIYSELQTKIHSTMSNVIKISRNKLKIKITGYVSIIYTLKD
jgi:hypothetical protein